MTRDNGGRAAPDYLRSLTALKGEIRARGWNRRPTGRVVAELLAHLTVFGAGAWVFFSNRGAPGAALGMALATLGSIGVATNTHTASHEATADHARVNALLYYLGYPLFTGMSATYWLHKHIAVHHKAANVLGVDDDIMLAPLFAITERTKAAAGPRARLWYRVQWLSLPLALAINGFNMLVTSWRFLAGRLVDRRRRKAAHWIDLGALAGHVLLWLALPVAFLPAGEVLAFYGLRAALMGYAMFAVFAPAHFPDEAVCLDSSADTSDFVAAVTSTTLNFRAGLLGRLLFSGVEYQIEHHLFPRVSHVHYPVLAPLVEAYCHRHGYPYRTLGWAEGVWKSLRVFHTPKRICSSLHASPLERSAESVRLA
jgi:linoleoyl-CoA desaturase